MAGSGTVERGAASSPSAPPPPSPPYASHAFHPPGPALIAKAGSGIAERGVASSSLPPSSHTSPVFAAETSSFHDFVPPVIAASLPRLRESCELGNSQQCMKIKVDLVGPVDLEIYEIDFYPEHTVNDLKEFFERCKGSDSFPVSRLVAYQEGVTLPNILLIKDIKLDVSISMVVTFDMLCGPNNHIEWVENSDGLDVSDYLPNFSEGLEFFDSMTGDSNSDTYLGLCDFPNPHERVNAFADQQDHCHESVQNQPAEHTILPSTTDIHSAQQDHSQEILHSQPTEHAVLTSNSSPTITDVAHGERASEPQVPERLLIPLNFSDQQLLEANIHGFQTSYQLRASINRRTDRWMTPNQYYGLISNPQIFSVGAIREENKRDGMVCVIDSSMCHLPQKLMGYKMKASEESDENQIGQIKCKGVPMDWFEVRGKIWARRRLILQGGDTTFHVIQWQHFPTTVNERSEGNVDESGENSLEHRWIYWPDMDRSMGVHDSRQYFDTCPGLGQLLGNSSLKWIERYIKQFYSTLELTEDVNELKFLLGEQSCHITRDDFAQALGLRNTIHLPRLHQLAEQPPTLESISYLYQNTQAVNFHFQQQQMLSTHAFSVFKVLRWTILPCARSEERLSYLALHIIHHLMSKIEFNIVDLMLTEIRHAMGDRNQKLLYAPYLMQVFIRQGYLTERVTRTKGERIQRCPLQMTNAQVISHEAEQDLNAVVRNHGNEALASTAQGDSSTNMHGLAVRLQEALDRNTALLERVLAKQETLEKMVQNVTVRQDRIETMLQGVIQMPPGLTRQSP